MIQEKVWVEVNKLNLEHNLQQFKQRIGDKTKLCCVVKSNAYGHDAKIISKISKKYADFFAVDSINEALTIKQEGIDKPIIILGYTLEDNLEQVIKNNFHQVIANLQTLEKFSQLTKKLNQEGSVHLKIETGTARQGIFIEDLNKYFIQFKKNPLLKLAGLSTHFANIEDTTEHDYAFSQLKKFQQAVGICKKQGFSNFIKHTACSAAAVLYPKTYFDMVRLGISMYGLWSSPQTLVVARQNQIQIHLKPLMTWKTKIAHIKILPPGSHVSYGCTEKVEEATKVAVLPVGYWDGYDRKLSSIGNVLIQGKRCKLIGRVCMNMMIVNINHLSKVNLEEEVVLLGSQNGQTITTEEMANKIGTINYEVVTRINPLIKRILV